MMVGETDLGTLIKTMDPVLDPATFVFYSSKHPLGDVFSKVSGGNPVALIQEKEGTTVILRDYDARALGLKDCVFPSRRITLNVHSSLEAVGFMAAISNALGKKGIGVNPVAGFYHDHIFVPKDRAQDAMETLGHLRLNGL